MGGPFSYLVHTDERRGGERLSTDPFLSSLREEIFIEMYDLQRYFVVRGSIRRFFVYVLSTFLGTLSTLQFLKIKLFSVLFKESSYYVSSLRTTLTSQYL